MRFNATDQKFEKVPLQSLAVGDEVLVQNPETKTVNREKITRVHDHSKEKRRGSLSNVKATEITIRLEAGGCEKEIVHVLASSHYMLTKRVENDAMDDKSASYKIRRADETMVGDQVLLNDVTMSGQIEV